MRPRRYTMVLLLAAGAAIALSSAPARAQLATKGELKCSTSIARTRAKLIAKKFQCVRMCVAKARRTSGPYTSCFPPFGGATADCIEDPTKGAEAKARTAILASCADDCPECYAPGVCTDPEPIIDAGADAVADQLEAVHCVENGGGTPTKAEAKCENAVGKALVRLARARSTCFNKCNAGIATERLHEDQCHPWGVKDPKTAACIASAEAVAVSAIDAACAPSGATPACYGGATGASWVEALRPLVDVQVPGKPDGTACQDGFDCTEGDFCFKSRCVFRGDVCVPADLCLNSHCDRRANSCTPIVPTMCPEITDACFISSCSVGTGICITRCVIPGACGAGPGPCGDAVSCTTAADCDDANLCTADSCEAGVCMNAAITCNDFDFCSIDFCFDPAVGCQARMRHPSECDDFDDGTVDTCEPFVGCVHTPG